MINDTEVVFIFSSYGHYGVQGCDKKNLLVKMTNN